MKKVGSGAARGDATRLVMALTGALLSCCSAATLAAAQPGGTVPAASTAPASTAVVINLIRLLVQEGVLTQSKAEALIRQAQDEAEIAARNRPPALAEATRNLSSPPPSPPPPAPAAAPSVHVAYVPEIVKQQIADEVTEKVESKAKSENWLGADKLPEWTKRFHLYGDVRMRYEWDLFDPRNSNAFPNFASLNGGSPFDIANKSFVPLPTLDTTTNRERMRLRARLGLDADITDGFSAGIRLATGNTTNPVSTNTTLGTDLNKDNFLLDLAYLQYKPTDWLTLWAGRFANPWMSTDLVWGPDLAFDGIAAQVVKPVNDKITPFATAGIFPIENTSFNFPDQNLNKGPSRDKWLYAVQAGLGWRPSKDYDLKFGLAYYDYSNIQGVQSSPCVAVTSSITCNTDNTRPGFEQQGNTLFAIRDTSAVPATSTNASGNTFNFQYFGLASPFHELDFNARLDYTHYDPIHVIFEGDFVTNLAFNSRSIAAKSPVNNLGPAPTDADGNPVGVGPWTGGANGFFARMTVGHPTIADRWDWNVSAAYEYLESDAVLDAFTSPDFHLGGTNAKGYILGGNLGVAHNIWLAGRWYSASEITGLPYTVNVVQVDLNARF